MIIGNIEQHGNMLITKETNIAYQHASNLELSVTFGDSFFDGCSFVWLYTSDKNLKDTHILIYDAPKKTLSLPLGAFEKAGVLYISARAIKDDIVISTSVVEFYIDESLNHKATNSPKDPGWEQVVHDLQEQFFEKEVMPQIQLLIDEAKNQQVAVNKKIIEINNMVENGDFDGTMVHNGIAAPNANLGNDDDLYLNTQTGDYYLKSKGAWVLKFNAKGPTIAVEVDTEGNETTIEKMMFYEIGDEL